MFVVVSGILVGKNAVESDSQEPSVVRVRHVVKGGSVNALHVLGVWHHCLETVVASTFVETYAVTESDFEVWSRTHICSEDGEQQEGAPAQHWLPLFRDLCVAALRTPAGAV